MVVGVEHLLYFAMTGKVPVCISDKKAITISKQWSACTTVFGRTVPKNVASAWNRFVGLDHVSI